MGVHGPVLLQTAQLELFNLESPSPTTTVRAIMDGGSQQTYITSRLRDDIGTGIAMCLSLPSSNPRPHQKKKWQNSSTGVLSSVTSVEVGPGVWV